MRETRNAIILLLLEFLAVIRILGNRCNLDDNCIIYFKRNVVQEYMLANSLSGLDPKPYFCKHCNEYWSFVRGSSLPERF
jgi:hypothetical protein